MKSLWEAGRTPEGFPPLDKNISTDVLIIGGGLCGLLCANLLREAGVDSVLVEAETICSGITKNTTAKITTQHGLLYADLLDRFRIDKARQYLLANEAALKNYADLCKHIDCDFEARDAFIYDRTDAGKLRREAAALKKLGADAEFCQSLPLPFPVAGAVRMGGQAQFHPLKFAAAISKGLRIYEHTRVQELLGLKAVTAHGTISAKRIIVATHFPFLNKHGLYFLKLYQHRSYVLALKNAPQVEGMYVDAAPNGLSFRNHGEFLLLGGGGHRTGKQGGGWKELRTFAAKHYPDAVECFHWAAQDCMSLDGVPYIGPYSSGTEGLYVATGFHKWGMSTSMAAAMLLRDELLGKPNPNASVFSPARSMLHPQLAINAWEATVGLLTPTKKRCPHLGCALKWNPQEHSWDCPCHGSRFAGDGTLLDNPANGGLK